MSNWGKNWAGFELREKPHATRQCSLMSCSFPYQSYSSFMADASSPGHRLYETWPRENPLPSFLAQVPHLYLLWVCFSWSCQWALQKQLILSSPCTSHTQTPVQLAVCSQPQTAVIAKTQSVPWQEVSCGWSIAVRCRNCCFRKPDPAWEHNMQECLRYKTNLLDFLMGLSSEPICRTFRFASQMPSKERWGTIPSKLRGLRTHWCSGDLGYAKQVYLFTELFLSYCRQIPLSKENVSF